MLCLFGGIAFHASVCNRYTFVDIDSAFAEIARILGVPLRTHINIAFSQLSNTENRLQLRKRMRFA